jgi:hypothetical protein
MYRNASHARISKLSDVTRSAATYARGHDTTQDATDERLREKGGVSLDLLLGAVQCSNTTLGGVQ